MSKKLKLKTSKNTASVSEYIRKIKSPERKSDARIVHKLMQDLSGDMGSMWGTSIVGYGSYTYKNSAGKEGSWMCTGWSSRKESLTLYIMPGYQFDDMKLLLNKLGPHKLGRSCLYIKHLDDIHIPTLKKIIKQGLTYMKKTYVTTGLT